MRNIKLTIEYDGTSYNGWQTQKNDLTVEDEIKKSLNIILNENIEFYGASRTDSGVHALGQTASFKTNSKIPASNLTKALNSMLPRDIVIKQSKDVEDNFNARLSCIGKKYIYKILNDEVPSAIMRNYIYYYRKKLDFEAMQEACGYFIGQHDFKAFSSTGSTRKTSIRTIHECYLTKNDNIIELHITGDNFLYNMIRIIVGTLIEVGVNNIRPSEIIDIILSKNRKRAGKTAPPQGLYLVELYY